MKRYEDKHGFTVTHRERINEIDGTLVDMTHDKSGARLIFLDRHDENTTFAIAFKTAPTDDTGVFHILEHCVLCGSKKFPVKDPFTELLKGSITTYLNALTSGDKTVYPVSSKNAKAFHGLVDVYLDAVFNPLVLENPYIFMQEGHRYELDEDGDLYITGVVYNEMKGVYSTADEYADYLITREVSPGGTYSYDAGGNPDFIPDLTYEDFKAAHDKFYHPSNSCLFLDGDVDLDDILPLIDSYLSNYTKRDVEIEITDGLTPNTEFKVATYPIEEEEDPTDKTRIYLCYNSYPHWDKRKLAALSLATEAIADLNSSPLTKRILDTGLCESFSLYGTNSYKVNALNAIFIGVKDGKEEELIKVYEDSIAEIIREGIPKEALAAGLKRREFNTRESDFGSYPAGMVYMRSCIDNALFGESPAETLKYEELFSFLDIAIEGNLCELLLDQVTSSPRATLILHPDSSFAEKKEEELYAKLDEIRDRMSEEEKAALIALSNSFHEWQSTPDSEEKLDTLPLLSISDLKTEPKKIPTDHVEIDGVNVLLHPLYTGGISYADLYFDASDADEDELHYIRLFTDLTFEWSTERGDSTIFRSKTKRHLGSFYLSNAPIKRDMEAKFYLRLHASCLNNERDNAIDVIEEFLYSTLYNDPEVLRKNLKQLYTSSLDGLTSRGDSYANMRSAARHSVYESIYEHLYGYEYHTFIKELARDVDEKAEYILARLKSISDKYFRRERLILGVTEADGTDFARKIVGIIHTGGTQSGKSPVKPLEKMNEGIAVPTTVSFSALGANLDELGENLFNGSFSIYQSIASLEILWNEIRVKNGAYDAGYSNSPTGALACHTYRDPSPAASIAYFKRLPECMDEFINTSPVLKKYIIGVFGSSDPVSTPRSEGALGTSRYLTGRVHEDFVKRRRQCLETTLDDLRAVNAIVAKCIDRSTFTVVGPRDTLERMENLDRILDI